MANKPQHTPNQPGDETVEVEGQEQFDAEGRPVDGGDTPDADTVRSTDAQ